MLIIILRNYPDFIFGKKRHTTAEYILSNTYL